MREHTAHFAVGNNAVITVKYRSTEVDGFKIFYRAAWAVPLFAHAFQAHFNRFPVHLDPREGDGK